MKLSLLATVASAQLFSLNEHCRKAQGDYDNIVTVTPFNNANAPANAIKACFLGNCHLTNKQTEGCDGTIVLAGMTPAGDPNVVKLQIQGLLALNDDNKRNYDGVHIHLEKALDFAPIAKAPLGDSKFVYTMDYATFVDIKAQIQFNENSVYAIYVKVAEGDVVQPNTFVGSRLALVTDSSAFDNLGYPVVSQETEEIAGSFTQELAVCPKPTHEIDPSA